MAIRRGTLIASIGAVFRERGYEGATLTQLAAATGLGKASLYHHFPGGKREMVEVLLRESVSELHRLAYARLTGPEPAAKRLQAFLTGFEDYLERNGGICLLGVLAMGTARESHGAEISAQLSDWRDTLTGVLEEAGYKPKRAARAAGELLSTAYGAQVVSRLLGDPRHLRRTFKRLGREFGGPR